ncbi:cysteine dioxygenase family protein [Aestuariibacter sp. AA17]|uniref:Cysteine dioxygenase family protein n=1 Tax=Fluctibacter corallii TaxID=2984329 RepID=A0ABT3A6Y7_9ALTE|nr:cysteine dioxygenase family protein [Aestuariibacter sp. AA17]MCV2884445.1 cysteine dioxygenase family protein [Aestuariibacter sp. AA17]
MHNVTDYLTCKDKIKKQLSKLFENCPQLDLDRNSIYLDIKDTYTVEANSYSRNILYSNENVEIVLAVWAKNIANHLHNHGDSFCSFIVIDGELTEQQLRLNGDGQGEMKLKTRETGDFDFIDDEAIFHLIENRGTQTAASIHIYSPPICTFERLAIPDFTEEDSPSLEKSTEY